MKREEKNLQTQRRILDSALAEFAQKGYGGSSVNAISSADGLSKGIIYHYFETKDELYLACVEECFRALTVHMEANARHQEGAPARRLEAYFDARLAFFLERPTFQRIFCGAIVAPPPHLADAIAQRKAPFDALNQEILGELLEPVALRPDISMEEVVEIFRQYQDFINARYQAAGAEQTDIRQREKRCRRALEILLHGVIIREGNAL